ncbi:MAG: sigma-70 family RNA polymerase sigma factor [Planctomycetota bacterium]
MSDAFPFHEALEGARRGESGALDLLTRRFYPTVQGLVHHRLASDLRRSRPWLSARFSTGDVVQDVFDGVLRDLGAFAGQTEEAFVGYLAAVVRNRIIDAIRFHEAAQRDGRRMHALGDEFDAEDERPTPAENAMTAEEFERLFRALAEFDVREQHLLRARLEGVSTFTELADQLGYCSESAARRAFYDAQARLTLRLRTN